MPSSAHILIAGAGPVGLTLACALRGAGLDCRIIDADDGPTPPEQSRALAIHARTLEALWPLLADSLVERGRPIRAAVLHDRDRPVARLEFDFSGLHTRFPFVLSLSQGRTEQILLERLRHLDADVEWRTSLTSLHSNADGVTAELTLPDGSTQSCRADWLVGCDGAHSAVRRALGLAFEGAAYDELFLLADARIDFPPDRVDPDRLQLFFVPDGVMPAIPLPEPGLWRLIDATGVVEASEPAAITDRFRDLLADCRFDPAAMHEPVWASAFRIHRRAVDRLRVGRCFLAGDAAHIHSPIGALGMNTGIQDALNLAWKLEHVIRWNAPDSLLDSYEAERLPVARQVLRTTDLATRIATLGNAAARAARNTLARFGTRLSPVRRAFARRISQLTIDYRDSPLTADPDRSRFPASAPRPGDRLPDFRLENLHEYGRGRFLHEEQSGSLCVWLFEGTNGESPSETMHDLPASFARVLREMDGRWPPSEGRYSRSRLEVAWFPHTTQLMDRWPENYRMAIPPRRIRHVPSAIANDFFGADRPTVYVIRPDGYIGYRAKPIDPDRLFSYLRHLLGD